MGLSSIWSSSKLKIAQKALKHGMYWKIAELFFRLQVFTWRVLIKLSIMKIPNETLYKAQAQKQSTRKRLLSFPRFP